MKTIVLLSCVKKKLNISAKAKDLYISTLFKYNLQYAMAYKPDLTFILSAKYGLVELEQAIEPYDMTLNNMRVAERKIWSKNVINSLQQTTDLENDMFIILAGEKYREYLLPKISHYEIPLEGFSFGKQLQELKRRLS